MVRAAAIEAAKAVSTMTVRIRLSQKDPAAPFIRDRVSLRVFVK